MIPWDAMGKLAKMDRPLCTKETACGDSNCSYRRCNQVADASSTRNWLEYEARLKSISRRYSSFLYLSLAFAPVLTFASANIKRPRCNKVPGRPALTVLESILKIKRML